MRWLVGLAAVLALSAPAWGQASAFPQVLRATPEQISAARAEGDHVLAAAQAQDLFENESGLDGTPFILLRHKASGFLCLLIPGSRINDVVVYPNPHRGDDVGCNTSSPAFGSRTTNFTRDGHTDEQMSAGAAVAIQRRFPDVQPAPAPTEIQPYATIYPSAPTPKVVRFLRADALEADISAHIDGWWVEDRITAPPTLVQSNALEDHWYVVVTERQRRALVAARQAASSAASRTNDPQTVDQVALARSEGDRMLAANGVQGLFQNVTDSRVVALRHNASGLICRFDLGSANAVLHGRVPGFSSRADAASCLSSLQAFATGLTILPNTAHQTAAAALDDAVADNRSTFANLRPYTGQTASVTQKSSGPEHRAVQMLSGPEKAPLYLYEAAAVVGDWIVIVQVRGPANPEFAGNLIGEMEIVTAINDLTSASKGM